MKALHQEVTSGYGYCAERYDAATGMIDLRARQYEPTLSHFSQEDILKGHIASPVSLNPYLYVKNDPANNYDPSGMVTSGQQWINRHLTGSDYKNKPPLSPKETQQANRYPNAPYSNSYKDKINKSNVYYNTYGDTPGVTGHSNGRDYYPGKGTGRSYSSYVASVRAAAERQKERAQAKALEETTNVINELTKDSKVSPTVGANFIKELQKAKEAGTLTEEAAAGILKRLCEVLQINVPKKGSKGSTYANLIDLLSNPKKTSLKVNGKIIKAQGEISVGMLAALAAAGTEITVLGEAILSVLAVAAPVAVVVVIVGGMLYYVSTPEGRAWLNSQPLPAEYFPTVKEQIAYNQSHYLLNKMDSKTEESDDSETKPSLKSAGNNKRANELAQEQGYDDAHDLKKAYVGKNDMSKYDIKYDTKTGEIYLENKDGTIQIPTGLYNK
jgi:RHS repeat-associated protein